MGPEPHPATDPSLFQLPLGIATLVILFTSFGSTAPDAKEHLNTQAVSQTPMFQATPSNALSPKTAGDRALLAGDRALAAGDRALAAGDRALAARAWGQTPSDFCVDAGAATLMATLDREAAGAETADSTLARTVLSIGGNDFADGLRKWIFDPLGMKKTSRAIVALESQSNPSRPSSLSHVSAPSTSVRLLLIHGA